MRLLPRDEKFFDLFSTVANLSVEAAKLQIDLLKAEPVRRRAIADAIKRLEHQADQVTHEVVTRLDRVFITPLDREDIHLLATRLDNVIDLIDGTARRAKMFHMKEVREPAKRLADALTQATSRIAQAVAGMKEPKTVAEHARVIKQLEEEGDQIYFEAVGALFANGTEPLEVMKWKDLYDKLEDALDECEDVSNTLESISLKNS